MSDTYNSDIHGLCRRINRFAEEMKKSVSSGIHFVNEFDVIRMRQYLGALTSYKAWVVGQPQVDSPESHPKIQTVPDFPEYGEIENESVYDACNLMNICWVELVNSQSSRMPNGLISFDAVRFDRIVEKMDKFLTDYIEEVQPVDLPESSPAMAMTGPGKTGV